MAIRKVSYLLYPLSQIQAINSKATDDSIRELLEKQIATKLIIRFFQQHFMSTQKAWAMLIEKANAFLRGLPTLPSVVY